MTGLDSAPAMMALMPGNVEFACEACEDWGTVVIHERCEDGGERYREEQCTEPVHARVADEATR